MSKNEVQISPNNDQSRDDSGDGDYFIEQDDKIVSVDHALQMREIDSFGGKTDNHREHERK
jgi:hypothetical protein